MRNQSFLGLAYFLSLFLARAARANCNRADLPLLARLGQPGKGARGASTACNTFGCIVLRRRQIIQITYRHSVSRGLLCRTESERRGTDGCAWLGDAWTRDVVRSLPSHVFGFVLVQ